MPRVKYIWSFALAKYWWPPWSTDVEIGSRALNPDRGEFSYPPRTSKLRMCDGVKFTCPCRTLPPRQRVVRSWPAGKSGITATLYSASTLSENQARPRRMGPDTFHRGDQVPM